MNADRWRRHLPTAAIALVVLLLGMVALVAARPHPAVRTVGAVVHHPPTVKTGGAASMKPR